MADYTNRIEKLSLMFELTEDKTPRDVALICRQVLEKAIDLIFEFENVRKPSSATLLELINNEIVQNFFNSDVIIDELHFVRIVGMNAHHDKYIKRTQAKVACDNISFLIQFMNQKLGSEKVELGKAESSLSKMVPSLSTIHKGGSSALISRSSSMSEAETRKVYIDLYLNEAGWDVLEPTGKTTIPGGKKVDSGIPFPGKACCEIPVQG
ncbi:MAG: hypothetical protein HUJ53_00475, partial [Holdemanella sp.]|nr:hypothetical protein [Holdemanella sp.]